MVNKVSGNYHLQFTVKLWKRDTTIPPSDDKYNVQICAADGFPFLDMKTIWSPEGGMVVSLVHTFTVN